VGRRYEIRVSGRIDPGTLDELGPLHGVTTEESTVLVGSAEDQAEVHGLLTRLHALGLEVVSVTRLPTLP
jgi:hypothetical protein